MKKQSTEDKGVLAKDMNLVDLKALAVQLELFTEKEVSKMKKADILKVVHAWEKKEIAKNKDLNTGLRKLGTINNPENTGEVADIFNDKKVVSRTRVELNGKTYEDILIETGETFRNLI